MPEFVFQIMGIGSITALFISNIVHLKCFQLYRGENFKEFIKSTQLNTNNIKDRLKPSSWMTMKKLKIYYEDPNADPSFTKLFRLGLITRRIGLWGFIITMLSMMLFPTK